MSGYLKTEAVIAMLDDWHGHYDDPAFEADFRALAASAPDEGPLPGQEVGHGCSPECNACRADRLAASAPDEGPREPTWSPTDPSTVEFPVDDGRPAVPALDVVAGALSRWLGEYGFPGGELVGDEEASRFVELLNEPS